MRPETAPVLLGLGGGLVLASLLVHLAALSAGPDSAADSAPSPAAASLPAETAAGDATGPAAPAATPEPAPAGSPATELPPVAADLSEAEPVPEPGLPAAASAPPASPSRADTPAAPASPVAPGTITVTVPQGATGEMVATLLADSGVIADRAGFLGLMRERQLSAGLRVGTYVFEPGEALEAVLERLVRGLTAAPAAP